MYALDDTQVEQALGDAEARGVKVRVLLNGGYYDQKEQSNDAPYAALQKLHVPVEWTPTGFALTHQKTLVVDGSDALIMTFNLQQKYYATGRDFAVDDTDPNDVSAIEQTFAADWAAPQTKYIAGQGDDLVWSPGSEDELLYLINSATSTLKIYNEEMDDADITGALVAAAQRGVSVQVDMTYATNWKPQFTQLENAGVEVRTFASSSKSIYIHAKMILADNARVFLGSENFSDTSLNKNRELGLVLTSAVILEQLNGIFDADWARARPFVVSK
jgi:phosphatidylserine/phosphatidylglycerophosphate/cardiolipin synthase-like enzyme